MNLLPRSPKNKLAPPDAAAAKAGDQAAPKPRRQRQAAALRDEPVALAKQNSATPAQPIATDTPDFPAVAAILPEGEPSGQQGEFERLYAQWRATGDGQIRERLILLHRPLVVYVARRFLDRGEQFEDLVQQGVIALIHALDQFDPARGVRFATFATPTIVGELRRYFRDKSWSMRVPRRLQELLPIVNLKIEALMQELNRSPTYAEIATALSLDIEEVVEILELPHRTDPVSLDDAVSTAPGYLSTVAEQVGANDPALENWAEYAGLQSALEKLPNKQRQVLELAYFQGYSQTEIARAMKVSQMHISRLQRRALSQLRELMES